MEITNDTFYKKGLCGITNLGNTCFMNTIMQCLNSNTEFSEFFLTNRFKKHLNFDIIDHNLVEQWALVCKALWDKNGVVTPTSFHKTIQIISLKKGLGSFAGFNQNDSQEFLQFFMETMHNGISKEVIMTINGKPRNELDTMAIAALTNWKKFFKNDYSYIVEKFYGQLYSVIKTPDDTKYKSETYEPFSNLCLEIPNEKEGQIINIYDCFDKFIEVEYLDGHRQRDDDTNKYYRGLSLWSTPKYLIIFFKRYNNKQQKIETVIDFPIEGLNLAKYCVGYDKNSCQYDLHAIANHTGGAGFGHYWACTKNMDKKWYKFNDKYVSLQDMNELVTKNVYCLFYKKRIN